MIRRPARPATSPHNRIFLASALRSRGCFLPLTGFLVTAGPAARRFALTDRSVRGGRFAHPPAADESDLASDMNEFRNARIYRYDTSLWHVARKPSSWQSSDCCTRDPCTATSCASGSTSCSGGDG